MAEMLEVRITGRNELQIPIDQATALLKQFGTHAGAINLSVANSAATGAVAFGNVYAQAFGKVISMAEQAATATARFGLEAIATGVKFNAQMETSRLGIAALVASFGEIRNVQGDLATGAQKWGASLQVAEEMQKKLLVAARQTPATYTELLGALQIGMGPGLAAGLDGDQMVKFTKMVAQAAGALGIASNQLGQEIRSLFQGDIGPDSRLANLLFTDIPRDKIKAYVEELKSSGQFFDEMERRMASFSKAGEEAGQTLTVSLSNFQDSFEQSMGPATQGLTAELTQSVHALTDVVGSPEFADAAKSFADSLAKIVSASEMLIRAIPGTITAIEDLVGKGRRAFNFVMDPLGIAPSLAGMMGGDSAPAGVGGVGGSSQAGYASAIGPGLAGDAWVLASARKNTAASDAARKEAERAQKELDKQLETIEEINRASERRVAALKLESVSLSANTPILKAWVEYQKDVADAAHDYEDTLRKINEQTSLSQGQRSGAASGIGIERTLRDDNAWREYNQKLYEAFDSAMDAADAKQLQRQLANVDAINDKTVAKLREQAEIYAEAVAKNMRKYESDFAVPFSNMLYNLAADGGKNFGEIAGQNFNRMIGEGASALTDLFAGIFGGGTITQDAASGQWFINGQPATQDQVTAAQSANSGMGRAMGYASIGIGSYMAPQQAGKDQSILGGAASGAMSGFSMSGNWVGAVIGAVVGAVGTYFGNQAVYDEYKYGQPYMGPDGQIGITTTDNMKPAEIAEWTAKIQAQYDKFWNGYVDIILKFGDSKLIPALQGIDGRIQNNPSKNFLKHLNEWINGTLPDEIAGQFKESMGTLYTSMGLTMEGFDTFWKRFDNLDPAKALELWGQLADALLNFNESITAFGGTITPGQSGFTLGGTNASFAQIMAGQQSRGRMTFSDTLREADDDLMDLADSLEHLTGEEQIRRANEISNLMMERYEKEKQYAEQLLAAQEEINRGWDAMVRSLTLQGFRDDNGGTDYDAQANYLFDYLNDLYQRMGTATSPDELQYLNNEAMNVLNQILGIAQNSGDPAYYEAMRQWALDTIEHIRTQTADRITALGDAVSQANQDFLDRFNPIFTAFQNAFQTAADVIGGGGSGGGAGGGRGAGGLVNDFSDLGAGASSLNAEFTSLGDTLRDLKSIIASIGAGGGNARTSGESYDYGAAVASRRRRLA